MAQERERGRDGISANAVKEDCASVTNTKSAGALRTSLALLRVQLKVQMHAVAADTVHARGFVGIAELGNAQTWYRLTTSRNW